MIRGRLVVDELRGFYAAHDGVPGAEVHCDRDVTWLLQGGSAWSSCGVHPRFSARGVGRRLDTLLRRFGEKKRGFGLWVDSEATPENLAEALAERGLRCRKRFPGMACEAPAAIAAVPGVHIGPLDDHGIYREQPHPYFGRIHSKNTRYELARLEHLCAAARLVDIVARDDEGVPLGACSVYLGDGVAGLHDVGVLERARGRGIGSALCSHAVALARERGCTTTVLLATGMGASMYARVGFLEVCRIAYWYRAHR